MSPSAAQLARPTRRSTIALLVVVLALATALTTLLPPPAHASETTPATVVRRTTLLTKAGHLRARYTVTSHRRGHCWTTSLENGHLYRCLSGNQIMDPCWKVTGRRDVVCLPVPWGRSVTRLRLTRALPATSKGRPALWGLRIGDGIGARCTASQGASFAVGGKSVSYYCGRGWVLMGRPDRSTPAWTMSAARKVGKHYQPQGRKHLAVAWRAVVH